MHPAVPAPVLRRADLDWLRVLAFGLLIFYHAGMAWSGWSWHVTSPDSLEGLREAMRITKPGGLILAKCAPYISSGVRKDGDWWARDAALASYDEPVDSPRAARWIADFLKIRRAGALTPPR